MKVKLIEDGTIVDVDDCWGERLVEQGKAVLPSLTEKPVKAEVTVTDKVPDTAKADEKAKAEPEKKAGKKR